jgi:hypothetical protein
MDVSRNVSYSGAGKRLGRDCRKRLQPF